MGFEVKYISMFNGFEPVNIHKTIFVVYAHTTKINMQNIWMLYACFAFDVMRLCIEQHGRCGLSTVQYLLCTHLIK